MYLLDTSVLIEAAKRYYRFDIAPGFWAALLKQARISNVRSIDKVLAELLRMNDDLAHWAKSNFRHAFASTKQTRVRQEYIRVVRFVCQQTHYSDNAKRQFADADNADAWLVAFALAHGGTIVTQETPAPYSKRVVKIPRCLPTFQHTMDQHVHHDARVGHPTSLKAATVAGFVC